MPMASPVTSARRLQATAEATGGASAPGEWAKNLTVVVILAPDSIYSNLTWPKEAQSLSKISSTLKTT